MTSRFVAGLLLFFSASGAFAQTGNALKKSNAHIGLIYPISSNGVRAFEYSNKVSIHALGGVSGKEEAFCISGIGSYVRYDANGLMASGIVNVITGNARGAHLAGEVNYIKGEANGLQGAGFVNVIGSGTGAQLAGFANVNLSYYRGLQGAGFVNVTKDIDGAQLAGYVNVAKNATGFQGAGFVNVVKNIKGSQVAGFANISGDVNTQVSGFVNVAKNVKGVQLSGFVNIADSSDFPIGFVNISKKGEKALGVTINDELTTLVTFRSGGRYLYGIVGLGGSLLYTNYPTYGIELGIGGHIPVSKHFRFNAELATSTLADFESTVIFNSSFRIMPALKLGNTAEIFAGPTFSYEYTDEYDYSAPRKSYIWKSDFYGYQHRMYIGGIAGLHFFL